MSKLKGYRVMLGLTQKELSDKLGISLQSYNNINCQIKLDNSSLHM